MTRIGIIGGGVAGLAAAWELKDHQVTVFEAQPKVGGLATGFKDENWDWTVENFYHHWFESDADLLKLTEELGVREKVMYLRPKTSFWYEDGVYQLDSPITALRLPIISWPGKIRFGFVGLYLRLTKQWRWMEKSTAEDWLRRYMGNEVYEKLWRPLLIGKFGEFYSEANMAWFWARLHSRTTKLGTYQGGFQAFLEDFAAALEKRNIEICLSTPVENIRREEDGKIHLDTAEGTHEFDAVISTTSPRLLLKLVPALNDSTAYAQKLSALRSMGAVVMVLSLENELMTDGTYWLSLPAQTPDKSKNEFPFLAMVEHTHFLDRKHFNGDHLVYLGDYVTPDHEYFQMSDEDLLERFLPSLSKVNLNFKREWIKRQWVFRAPYAQPLPTVNHSQNIPDLRTPISGLYWASMSQVYPWDRGTNYAVEIGRRVARLAVEDLA